jgi:O-antigen/teichoic acid export membrane protein
LRDEPFTGARELELRLMEKQKLSISEYHGLAKNSLWGIASNISLVFVLVLTVLASRVLGDSVFGQYTFLLAVTTLLVDLSVLGTTDFVSIVVAREPGRTREMVANVVGLRIPASVLFVVVCLGIAWLSMPEAIWAALLISLDWVVRTVIHLLRGVLRARNVFRWDTQVATIERLAVLVCGGSGLFLFRSLNGLAVGYLVGRLVGMAASIHAYYRLGEVLRFRFQLEQWRRLIRGGLLIGVRGMLKGVSFRVDAFMLGLMRASSEVGWYGAAFKFLEASFFIQDAVGASFQPAISRAFGRKKRKTIAELYGRGLKVLLIVAGFATAAGVAYSYELIAFVFGTEYVNASSALMILICALPFVYCSMTSIVLLDAVGSQGRTVTFFAISVVLNLGLNLLLIPLYGYIGAAITTVVTEVFLAVALTWHSFRSGYVFPMVWVYGPLAASLAFIALALTLPTVIGALAGTVVFAATLLLMGVFDEADFGYGRDLLVRIKVL